LDSDPSYTNCKGKIVQEEFHASKEKGSEKEKETLIASEEVSREQKFCSLSREAPLEGFFVAQSNRDSTAESAFDKIWVVPWAGW